MKKLLFIMNPYAGTRKGVKHLAQIIGIFNQGGYEVTAFMTKGPGHCRELVVERAGSVDLIVCCGGDGTFNEAIAGLISCHGTTPVGYIPAGSTNDFAASLGLSLDLCQAARDIVGGRAVTYDAGSFAGRIFSYVASFGIFTRSSYATPQSLKNLLGHTAYVLQGATELTHLRTYHLRFDLPDGRSVEDDFVFGAISNSTSMAGILTLDPKQVDMRDGKLELMLIRKPKSMMELAECIACLQKQQYNSRIMTFLSTPSVTVTAPQDMPWTLDGEREEGRRNIQIDCLPLAYHMMQKQPKKVKLVKKAAK